MRLSLEQVPIKGLLFAFFVLWGQDGFAKNLVFKSDGKVKTTFKSKKFSSGRVTVKGIEIGSVDKTLINAWRGYERTYRGYSFYELLDGIYGKDWRKAKKIVFVASDGYRQMAKIKNMLKASARKSGYIAFTETGKKGFSKFRRGDKIIDPGPFYLVWSGFNRTDQAKHSDILKWPYQLKTINIESY